MNKYSHIFFNDLHFQIIEQVKKFNDKEVEPNGLQWENDGCVPNEIIKKLDVRTSGSDALARSLSGGNLQKFVIGRELIQNPKIFIVNQPTWGVDAAAASSIRQQILDLAKDGAAVIVISQDLDELLEISDVFCALVGGQLPSPENTSELNPSKIGMLISNSKE